PAYAAHAKPKPGENLLTFERRTGESEHVTVPRGVDDDVGEDRETARFALERDAAKSRAIDDRIARPAVEQQSNLRLGDHLRQGELRLLRVVGDGVAHAVRTLAPHQAPPRVVLHPLRIRRVPLLARWYEGGASAGEAVGELLAKAADDLPTEAVVESQQ